MEYHPYATVRTLFLKLTAALVAFLLLLVCFLSKKDSFLAANFYHAHWLDTIFIYFTNLGDGIFAVLLIIAFFVFKKRTLAVKLLISFLLSGFAAQLLKRAFHYPRPMTFFTGNLYHHFITGVTNCGLSSFPSGHATTAFAVAATLAFNIPSKKWCIAFFSLATAIIYSRVYLGHHFVEDILAGIILGVATSLFIEYLYSLYEMNSKSSKQASLLQHE